MKKVTVFLLLVCLAALLVGCGGQKETVDGGAQSKTQAATDVKEEAAPGTASEAETDSGAEKDTPTQQGGAAKADTGSSAGDEKPAVGKTPARENGASAPSKAGPAGGESSDSAGSSSSKPAGNSPSVPAGSGTDAVETPAPQPEEKVFDMDYWLGYAKDYAVGIGLRLDENAADSWDTPIRCSSKTEDVLAAYIRDDLTYYKNEEGCTAVWIWAEQVGDGQYELFIGRG
ncbi:hypothetical protein MM35RIKEN_12650 [Vescimonas fastidiosa]|uniref:Uncharacterized protein n=1 Tax=Vescimonas fastidiosa TaxID=2714353 RepID=A0A810Q2S0_9FIRM|nr:hypothetical protein [Vescimonas fastidiosa]BCK79073.1 hypothetical protein MM35RIKEN_12650 [Vescimonas fastidiosa]